MKKFLLLPLLAVALVFIPSTAGANHNNLSWALALEEEKINVKVDICHWASGNLSVPHPSVSAVGGAQDTGHGLLTLNAETGAFISFVPHTETGGHEEDSILRVYLQHGNSELTLYAAQGGCVSEDPEPELLSAFLCFEGKITTLTDETQTGLNAKVHTYLEANVGSEQVLSTNSTCDVPVTPTTAPPVIVEKEVVKVVEVPGPVQVVEKLVQVPAPVAAPLPAAAPASQLPRTGSGAIGLLIGGLSLVGTGSALRILSKMRRAGA